MNINSISVGDIVYYPRLGQQVKVRMVDEQSEYVKVEDRQGNTYDVHCSKLSEVINDVDMNGDDILNREG